jgi:hypothetical protein
MNSAALQANLSKFVFIGRRPTSGKRRKRHSGGKEKKRKMLEESTESESTGMDVSDALVIQNVDKQDTEPPVADEMKFAGLDAETITATRKKFGSNEKQELSESPKKSRFTQKEEEDQNDEETVEASEDLDDAEQMHQAHVYRDDLVQLGFWPLANVDNMYQALVMIAEGYSQYHQILHIG